MKINQFTKHYVQKDNIDSVLFESGTLLPPCCLIWDTLFVKIKVLNLKSNFADQTETRKQKTAETGTRFIATASRTESGRRGPEFYLHDNKQTIFMSLQSL